MYETYKYFELYLLNQITIKPVVPLQVCNYLLIEEVLDSLLNINGNQMFNYLYFKCEYVKLP